MLNNLVFALTICHCASNLHFEDPQQFGPPLLSPLEDAKVMCFYDDTFYDLEAEHDITPDDCSTIGRCMLNELEFGAEWKQVKVACKEPMHPGKCYNDKDEWLAGCSLKRCIKHPDGTFEEKTIEQIPEGDPVVKVLNDGCQFSSCQSIVPGCYYKREKKCYPVGTNKRVGCSRIECRLDATGKKASFVGTTTQCRSFGKCVDVGAIWFNKKRCIDQKCTKTVDEFGTELHRVERTRGCRLYGKCNAAGHTIQVNPCSEVVCARNGRWVYSKRGCYIDGQCKEHLVEWKNSVCDTEKCFVTISKRNGPKVQIRHVKAGCKDSKGACRDVKETWDEPSMDIDGTCPSSFKAVAKCWWYKMVVTYESKCSNDEGSNRK
ncbi:Hypothetical predicted protein [Mytilus galloprovincialis]|uniref:Uncharacterized protein n=2 Tax=Mytilus galloprovincialis TaxID=29158 RepID=A0A8B6CMU7_MYTGA|nr:Hypothetical predicted protein [Mytilus galloprovincialis]